MRCKKIDLVGLTVSQGWGWFYLGPGIKGRSSNQNQAIFQRTWSGDERAMEVTLDGKERITQPRFIIELPFEYQGVNRSCLRGATLTIAKDGGFLVEAAKDLPVSTELSISVLFPKGFELANFKVTAKTVWKRPCRKGDWKGNKHWEGYQYGLQFIQISDTDLWKLNYILGGRLQSAETFFEPML